MNSKNKRKVLDARLERMRNKNRTPAKEYSKEELNKRIQNEKTKEVKEREKEILESEIENKKESESKDKDETENNFFKKVFKFIK